MGEAPRHPPRNLIGSGHTDLLLTTRIDVPAPARELLEMRKTVLVDRADTTLENVLLQGRLRAAYLLPLRSPNPAPVTLLTAEIAFAVRIPVPGAAPGHECTVNDAFVSGDASSTIPGVDGGIAAICDRSVVRLGVQILAVKDADRLDGKESGLNNSALAGRRSAPTMIVSHFARRPRR